MEYDITSGYKKPEIIFQTGDLKTKRITVFRDTEEDIYIITCDFLDKDGKCKEISAMLDDIENGEQIVNIFKNFKHLVK